MRSHDFDEIRDDFLERVNRMVYCSVATVDRLGRPRSRILHPIWEGNTGWISTDPRSPKSQDLAHNPHVSLAYISDVARPVYADCVAEWMTDTATKQHVWDLYLHAEPPLGFDPATAYGSVHEPKPGGPVFGVLKLTPFRIRLYHWPTPTTTWTPKDEPEPVSS